MFNHLLERVRFPDRRILWLSDEDEVAGPNAADRTDHLIEFRLELGLPVWRYSMDGIVIDRRVLMPHGQNTVHVTYQLVEGEGADPPHASTVGAVPTLRVGGQSVSGAGLHVVRDAQSLRAVGGPDLPCLRLTVRGSHAALTLDEKGISTVPYQVEQSRGYDAVGSLWSPGYFRADLTADESATLIASTESWDAIEALSAAARRKPKSTAASGCCRSLTTVMTPSVKSWFSQPTSSSSPPPVGSRRRRGRKRQVKTSGR